MKPQLHVKMTLGTTRSNIQVPYLLLLLFSMVEEVGCLLSYLRGVVCLAAKRVKHDSSSDSKPSVRSDQSARYSRDATHEAFLLLAYRILVLKIKMQPTKITACSSVSRCIVLYHTNFL